MCSYDYIKHKGYQPKVFSEIISETLNLNLKDFSLGGSSNQGIFSKFVLNLDQIGEDDIFLFGWTQNVRFNVATKSNGFLPIIIGGADEKTYDFIDIPFQSRTCVMFRFILEFFPNKTVYHFGAVTG